MLVVFREENREMEWKYPDCKQIHRISVDPPLPLEIEIAISFALPYREEKSAVAL